MNRKIGKEKIYMDKQNYGGIKIQGGKEKLGKREKLKEFEKLKKKGKARNKKKNWKTGGENQN